MKKILFAVLAITLVSSLCFAQQATAPTTKAASITTETKTFTGKADSVSLGDAAKGTKSEIIVMADNGQKMNFVVKAGTPITTKDGKAITLTDIKKDNKVSVEYTMSKMGAHKAQSIKLVE